MKNLWNSAEAAGFPGDLGQRVYSSRLLGREPSLVLHGGGNTSVKISEKDLFGAEARILRIKASGSDLASIGPGGFAPCRIDHLLRLAALPSLSDERMAAELRVSMTDPAAPNPSVEAILHALVPARYVDHTHAEALLALSNTDGGPGRAEDAYGGQALVLPYVMPGFALARQFHRKVGSLPKGAIGIVLLGHGLVSFGETAEESYSRMIQLAGTAESYLGSHRALNISWEPATPPTSPQRAALAAFRKELCAEMGGPAILTSRRDARTLGFARRADLAAASQEGPATPDHAIRTKRVPLLGRGVASYRAAYEAYFASCAERADPKPARLDPAPRIVVDPEWGLLAAGRSAAEASAAADIFSRTMDVIARAAALGGWRGLPAQDIFNVEYWDLEQAKLRRAGRPPEFSGEIALVTGAASGIGKACVEAFLARGAAVVGLDINPAVSSVRPGPAYLGIECDLTDEGAVGCALESAVMAFGGVDMLVVNAGIFPQSSPISAMATDTWQRAMAVNLNAGMVLLRECHPLLRAAPNGGRVVVVGSKNVPAPGPGAAAYSSSKAALTQLARVAALEWGADRIRVNTVHPNMVFDTALWSPELLQARARSYGMSVETYRTSNLLRTKVTSRDVAEMAAALCGSAFARTTGAQVPVDGGNERVV